MKSRIVSLLALPFLVHAIVVSAIVAYENPLEFGWLELGMLGGSLAWLLAFVILSRGGRVPTRLVAGSWAILLMLLVIEATSRWLAPLPLPGLPWPPMSVHSTAADTMKGISGPIDFTTNRLGLRGPEVVLNEMDLRVLCVGGSATECRYVTDRASWPWKLQDELADRLDQRVFVGNAGKGALMVAEHERLIREYRYAKQFDRVVALCGIYDACVHLSHNRRGRLEQPDDQLLTPQPEPVPWYAYYRGLAIKRFVSDWIAEWSPTDDLAQDPAGEWYREARRQRRAALERARLTEPPEDLLEMLEVYREDLRSLIATCRERDLKLLLLTQPTRFGSDLPPEVVETFIVKHYFGAYTPAAYARIMEAFNRTLLEVAEEEGVDSIDLAARISQNGDAFYDDFHLNTAGCAQVADILAEFFLRETTTAPERQ